MGMIILYAILFLAAILAGMMFLIGLTYLLIVKLGLSASDEYGP